MGFVSLIVFIPEVGIFHLVFKPEHDFELGHCKAALSSAPVATHFQVMPTALEFCLPAAAVPIGPDWIHEIKYDGYWLRLSATARPCG